VKQAGLVMQEMGRLGGIRFPGSDRIPDPGPRIPGRSRLLLRFSIVVFRAGDLAARPAQISLKIAAFPAVQPIAGSAVDAFLGADGGFVGAQAVQLAAGQLMVLPAVPDAQYLAMLASVDSTGVLLSRCLILRERAYGARKGESKRHHDDSSNQHASSFGHWLPV
jgi:hypothetical protein